MHDEEDKWVKDNLGLSGLGYLVMKMPSTLRENKYRSDEWWGDAELNSWHTELEFSVTYFSGNV